MTSEDVERAREQVKLDFAAGRVTEEQYRERLLALEGANVSDPPLHLIRAALAPMRGDRNG